MAWYRWIVQEDYARMKLLAIVVRNSTGAAFGSLEHADFVRFLESFDPPRRVTTADVTRMQRAGVPVEDAV